MTYLLHSPIEIVVMVMGDCVVRCSLRGTISHIITRGSGLAGSGKEVWREIECGENGGKIMAKWREVPSPHHHITYSPSILTSHPSPSHLTSPSNHLHSS